MGENNDRKKRNSEYPDPDPDLSSPDWTTWEILVSPVQTNICTCTRLPRKSRCIKNEEKYNREKENRPGYRKKPKNETIPKKSGVYELGRVKLSEADTETPQIEWVYVGKSGNLFERLVRKYANSGAHIQDNIKLAINDGYSIVCRYEILASVKVARLKEKRILAKFAYLWNIQENKDKKVTSCLQTRGRD